MYYRQILSIIVILFFSTYYSNVEAQNSKVIFGSETLIPFEYEENGKPAGINVQLIDLVMKEMGRDYEIIFPEDERSLDLARKGEIDIVMSVSYKESREDFLIYPDGFHNEQAERFMWSSEYVFFTTSNNIDAFDIDSYEDIRNQDLKVGVISGVSYNQEFWDANLNVIENASDEENFKALLNGDIDVYLTDRIIGRYTAKGMNISSQVGHFPRKFINKPYTIAVSRKSNLENKEAFLIRFFEEFELIKKKGIAKQIYLKTL
jgi:polar amino acid transport system substrate-binding protein